MDTSNHNAKIYKSARKKKIAERVRQLRAELTDEQRAARREADRIRKANKRAEMSVAQKIEIRNKDKLSKAKIRKEVAATENGEQKELRKIEQVLATRKSRSSRTEEIIVEDNKKAQSSMELFRKEGRLRDFEKRQKRDLNDSEIWKKYWNTNKESKETLKTRKPDIAKKMENHDNEIRRQVEREKEEQIRAEQERAELKAGKWYYNPAMEDYMWSGEGPPPEDEPEVFYDFPDDMPTITSEQAVNRENARLNRKRLKEKLNTPIQLDQDHELSEYEKLREKNIKEINEAMQASGLF